MMSPRTTATTRTTTGRRSSGNPTNRPAPTHRQRFTRDFPVFAEILAVLAERTLS
jgi:hypothetical protein